MNIFNVLILSVIDSEQSAVSEGLRLAVIDCIVILAAVLSGLAARGWDMQSAMQQFNRQIDARCSN